MEARGQPSAPVLSADQYRLLLGAAGVLGFLALAGLVNIFRRPRNAPPGARASGGSNADWSPVAADARPGLH